MVKGIYMAARNLDSKVKNIQIIANNLANISTTGYKREIPFSEIMSRFETDHKKQITDHNQGELLQTANPLNMAISGEGFFVLQTDNGYEMTRNGNFKISEEGFLINDQGFKVMGKKGEINVLEFALENDRSFSVANNGEITMGKMIVDELLIGRIDESQEVLRKEGLNFAFEDGDYFPADNNTYEIFQGFLENSNINPVLEMQAMIFNNKDFETTQKVINAFDQSMEKANEIGKI